MSFDQIWLKDLDFLLFVARPFAEASYTRISISLTSTTLHADRFCVVVELSKIAMSQDEVLRQKD